MANTNDLFKQLGGVMKESRQRWECIEKEVKDIKEKLNQGTNVEANQLAGLLLLVIEQLKPLYSYDGKIEADFNDVLKKILKK